MDFTLEEQLEFSQLIKNYKVLDSFIEGHKKLNYVQLDYAFVHNLSLFTIDPDFSLDTLEKNIDAIVKVLPAIKNIFAKPFIHLKEQNIILPTEAVRVINNNTIQHISSHSELWTDIKENTIQPAKLLTRVYDDDYGIYENIVFCKIVDDILAFTRENIAILKDLIYTNQTIEINILERVNHLNYFLALGKLHTGYNRNFDLYYESSMRCLNKLMFLLNSLVTRLKLPVYKNNRKRPRVVHVHKTNILSMHKDYHQIYKLSKYFAVNALSTAREVSPKEIENLEKNYTFFCTLLCIFSIGHFNFACDAEKGITFSRLNMVFHFKEWKLTLQRKKVGTAPVIWISIVKDKECSICIVPSVKKNGEELCRSIQSLVSADECILFSPYEEFSTYIHINNIESFRRIQQIILRGMIYADTKRTECPFCMHPLTLNTAESSYPVYECSSCRTIIGERRCPTKEKTYSYTKISRLTKQMIEKDQWLYKRKREAQMYFRNITGITEDLEILCPYCNEIHK